MQQKLTAELPLNFCHVILICLDLDGKVIQKITEDDYDIKEDFSCLTDFGPNSVYLFHYPKWKCSIWYPLFFVLNFSKVQYKLDNLAHYDIFAELLVIPDCRMPMPI